MTTTEGPTLPISKEIHATKYRQEGETFRKAMTRVAHSLKDSSTHFDSFRDALLDMRFLPAGRVQASMGASRVVTPYNCFVSETIDDSMDGIMRAATRAATTLRMGGGIGYDFSTLRPKNDRILSLDSQSSGPVSFMDIFNALCGTISAAGHRRGAQMGVLRVDHPDIEEFVRAKSNLDKLTNFNISVAVTDKFMECVDSGDPFPLVFEGKVYRYINASNLWDEIMRITWDWAEPGVLFIDAINRMNNLWYAEKIAATNPCAEQPLPPNGACLLGSFNLTKYVNVMDTVLDYDQLTHDIPQVVRAMDNIVDRAIYPLPEQEEEAKNKRRMGLGLTGVANAIEALGKPYAAPHFLSTFECVMKVLVNECYRASANLAAEKGPFPLWSLDNFMKSPTWFLLDEDVQGLILQHGLRNSHLISIAPTGTISLTADNISSGIEPVFSYGYDRTINMPTGVTIERVDDYGVRVFGVKGKTADECTIDEHLSVLLVAQKWTDSAVSKTCNVGADVSFEDFKDVYMKAWHGGAKGCTTFRAAGKRMGIFNAPSDELQSDTPSDNWENTDDRQLELFGSACFIDPTTGKKTCD